MEVSAKDNINIELLLNQVIDHYVSKYQMPHPKPIYVPPSSTTIPLTRNEKRCHLTPHLIFLIESLAYGLQTVLFLITTLVLWFSCKLLLGSSFFALNSLSTQDDQDDMSFLYFICGLSLAVCLQACITENFLDDYEEINSNWMYLIAKSASLGLLWFFY
jgi:hypothetical protein